MKQILFIAAIILQSCLGLAQATIDLPAFIRCRDEVSAYLRSSNAEEVIHNDIDGKRFIAKVSSDAIYLGKVEVPGLYNITIDTTSHYYFAYSCRDHKVKNSIFPLQYFNIPCAASGCHTDALNVLAKEFQNRPDTAFISRVDLSGRELQRFIDSGQTFKVGFFFDIANKRIAVIGESASTLPSKALTLTFAETFFTGLYQRLRPDSTAASNQALAALMKAAVETVLTGATVDASPNFQYAPFVIDDLISAYNKKWIDGAMHGVALKYEPRYSGQIVFLMSVSLPPRVKPRTSP